MRFLYLTVLLIFWGCSDEQAPTQHKQPSKPPNIVKVKQKKDKPKISFKPITTQNVVKRLSTYGKANPETIVDLFTSKGKIRIKLFEDTPLHRANFILLTKSGYLNGCLFSRVVKNFMAQAGGSYDDHQKNIQDTLGVYTIPAEISSNHFHKKGAVGAARNYKNNPEKRSECDEFYLVEGSTYNDLTLDHYEDVNNYLFSPTQRQYYLKEKGAAHIDGEHTVFGEIIHGYHVVSQLTHVATDSQDWPVVDLYIDSAVIVR